MLVQGVEPSFRWRAFAIELMELAQAADVSMVVTLGALMADVAHSRPIPVSATSDSEDTRHRHDLEEQSGYEGPTGIVGVLADAATQVGVPSVSCWAAVPHGRRHSPSPKATLALVSRLEELLDGPIEHRDLDEDSGAWERGIDELASSDEEVAEYVESLEEAQDTAELPEASGDAIAKEFERYLRRRRGPRSPVSRADPPAARLRASSADVTAWRPAPHSRRGPLSPAARRPRGRGPLTRSRWGR